MEDDENVVDDGYHRNLAAYKLVLPCPTFFFFNVHAVAKVYRNLEESDCWIPRVNSYGVGIHNVTALTNAFDSSSSPPDSVFEEQMRKCGVYRLEIHLYNLIASGVVFVQKLLFLTMAILGIFITVGFGHKLPVLVTGLNAIMAVVGIYMYNFMYDAAVWMPSRFSKLVHKLKNENYLVRSKSRKLVQLELESIRKARMSVGSFGSFARTTRLEYVDFVMSQVANLLITFR